MKRKAKEEWWGTFHRVYGDILKDVEYEVPESEANEPMWEKPEKKKTKE